MLELICAACIMLPSENYYSDISPNTAEVVLNEVIAENYHTYLDYNGDGALNIADVVCIKRKYEYNIRNGNIYHFDRVQVNDIITENYSEYPIEWEIVGVNDMPCSSYDITVSEITRFDLLLEFDGYSELLEIQVNPYTESIAFVKEK